MIVTVWRGATRISWVEARDAVNLLQCPGQHRMIKSCIPQISVVLRLRNSSLEKRHWKPPRHSILSHEPSKHTRLAMDSSLGKNNVYRHTKFCSFGGIYQPMVPMNTPQFQAPKDR